ncbi:OmpA family protein [Escherichia marmotae]|nr:OmpA family protein [Escherichia marmotae]
MNNSSLSQIEQIFYPGWLMASQLRGGQEVRDGEGLYRRACRLVHEAQKSLSDAGYSDISREHMVYALCALLDDWQQRGEPVRYRFGLYQGQRLIPAVEAVVNDQVLPPSLSPSSLPVIKKIVQGPKTIRLDSMSLFDSGKSALKAGSTKMLVNSLVGVKAMPGWLIVVAGHTDNTGNAQRNQTLSQKRAEAVRDWMHDTGDVPESCFAVQGYGESRPLATNDTPEGRALNRRVEISLVSQANACQMPGHTLASSQDDAASQHNRE